MTTATLLFTYNRSYHTEQVINSLRCNTLLPGKLFVFQDGLKEGMDDSEWKKVNQLIHNIDWCDKEIIVSEYNKGLAVSIVSGINYAFQEYDAVIVLEDDCVITANFMKYMQQCFEKYQDNKKVYSVSGYAWPFVSHKTEYDVYGCGRVSSWGWGTWKDRWKIFEKDYEIIKRMKQQKASSENLAIWGRDLEEMLVGNVRGELDSWAVFWALNVIAREGICIAPYKSLVKNIGMDGSGVHCHVTNKFETNCMDEGIDSFHLPDKIAFLRETKAAFAPVYGSYTAITETDRNKENILVYGAGYCYIQNEKIINEKYNVIAFVDRKKRGWFAGKKILKADEIEQYRYAWIIIAVQSAQECQNIKEVLMDKNIDTDKIITVADLLR